MLSFDIKKVLKNKMKIIKKDDHSSICMVGPVQLPVQLEDNVTNFNWYTWLNIEGANVNIDQVLNSLGSLDLANFQQSSVLVYGDFKNKQDALVRFHSTCHTGDIFGSKRCDCGFQLRQSLKMIGEHGHGALFYLANHEGRGIGLFAKSLAYILQQEGHDTVEANLALGLEDDIRSYEEALIVLQQLRSKPVTLITNNPKKLLALKEKGLSAKNHCPLWGDVSDYNRRYLETKVQKSGHIPELKRMTV